MNLEEKVNANIQKRENELLQYHRYFAHDDNPGLRFINDLENALRKNWLDGVDACLTLDAMFDRMRSIRELAEQKADNQNPRM